MATFKQHSGVCFPTINAEVRGRLRTGFSPHHGNHKPWTPDLDDGSAGPALSQSHGLKVPEPEDDGPGPRVQ